MINIMSYVGMNLQAEVCMWTLMGLILTIFDATLFKVNANLKQVWLMDMPQELPMSIQHGIRIVISGTMLVQCFSVYAYLASYIVLLYPVILEERHILVLPWLLLAAIKQLLCELTNLALGLGICVLLGASRPSCIKFLITKIISIMPSWYMWMLVLSYYRSLKIAATFKTFPTVLPAISNNDVGLELAIRRRRTKSLFNEEMLRRKLVNFYQSKPFGIPNSSFSNFDSLHPMHEIEESDYERFIPTTHPLKDISDFGNIQDLLGNDTTIPRDTDRILEQFVIMLLRVACYLKTERGESIISIAQNSAMTEDQSNYLNTPTDIPSVPLVSSSSYVKSPYITDFPQIFQRKQSDVSQLCSSERIVTSNDDRAQNIEIPQTSIRTVSFFQNNQTTFQVEKSVSVKTFDKKGNIVSEEETTDKPAGNEILKEYIELLKTTSKEKFDYNNLKSEKKYNVFEHNRKIKPKTRRRQKLDTSADDFNINKKLEGKQSKVNISIACSSRTIDSFPPTDRSSTQSSSISISSASVMKINDDVDTK